MAVHTYNDRGVASNTKGSKHPEAIGAGLEITASVSKGDAALAKPSGSGKDAGGTANLGAKQKSHQGGLAKQPGTNDSAPTGLKAPHGNKF